MREINVDWIKFLLVGHLLLATVNGECDHGARTCFVNEYQLCLSISDCAEALNCMDQKCGDTYDEPSCAYKCGFFNPALPLLKLSQCMADHGCVPHPTPTAGGQCIGSQYEADQSVNATEMLAGQWWTIKGRCNEPYDIIPCMKQDVSQPKPFFEDECQSKSSFTYGVPSQFQPEYITVYSKMRMETPGIFESSVTSGSAVTPQVTKLVFLAMSDDSEVALVSACSTAPFLNINTLNVMSKRRSFDQLSTQTVDQLKKAAAKIGIDLDKDMCNIDTRNCDN